MDAGATTATRTVRNSSRTTPFPWRLPDPRRSPRHRRQLHRPLRFLKVRLQGNMTSNCCFSVLECNKIIRKKGLETARQIIYNRIIQGKNKYDATHQYDT